MERARKCLECGLPIPDAEEGNHCPNCLFRLAFLPPESADEEASDSPALPNAHPHYFAGYEMISQIAHGGMGVVWKARQLGVNRLVALKMIPAGHLASPQMRLRFRIEIETVVQLDHPNIVPLYETGEHEGQHYFSMKLLEGGNLGEWIARRQRDHAGTREGARTQLRAAMRLLITITRAVHHAHQRGILHRDLKPSNILLDQQGEPHVADFGLAKVLGRDSGITITESALGSPNYMSPEQASGHPAQLTVAADVYGLGAILYELLTGQPPFQGATAVETMRRVVDEEATSPRQLNPAIDADLETICLKCLQKQPGRRYESADALAADLERWLAGQPIEARPVGPAEQFTRWCRRQPALATALGLALLLLLVVVIGTTIAGIRIARAERIASAQMRESLLGQARILRLNSSLGGRKEGLDLIRAATSLGGTPEYRLALRNELLALLARTDVGFVSRPHLTGSPNQYLNLLSPDGDRFATVVNSGTVKMLNATDGSELTQFTVGPSPIRTLEGFSRDGRFLAMRHDDSFSIWDAQTGKQCFTTNQANVVFCFAQNTPAVLIQTGRKIATFYELPTMRALRQLSPYTEAEVSVPWTAMAISPDNRRLAAVRWSSRVVELIDLQTSTHTNLLNEGRAHSVGWSADSKRLAVGTTTRRVIIWDTDAHRRTYVSNIMPSLPHQVALNPQGSLLAAGCNDGTVRFFDGVSPQPSYEIHGDISAAFAFDEGGNKLQPVFRKTTAGFVELRRPRSYFETVVDDRDTGTSGCLFSHDGQILAVGTTSSLKFCSARDGTILSRHAWSINSACFDPRAPSIMAAGTSGMYQWDMQGSMSGELSLARQRRVQKGPGWRAFTYSAGGDWFVAVNTYSNAAFVFDRTLTNIVSVVGPHPGLEFTTISPNGRWVVTGADRDRRLRVWDTQQNREVLPLPGSLRSRAAFSADGKWLVAFGASFELREVDSWKLVPLFSGLAHPPVIGAAAFSSDGKTLAVVTDVRDIHLIDLPSLQTLTILRPPGATEIYALAFSPDSTRLAAVGDAVRLRVWNLPELREQLAEFQLDWQTPPPNQAEARR